MDPPLPLTTLRYLDEGYAGLGFFGSKPRADSCEERDGPSPTRPGTRSTRGLSLRPFSTRGRWVLPTASQKGAEPGSCHQTAQAVRRPAPRARERAAHPLPPVSAAANLDRAAASSRVPGHLVRVDGRGVGGTCGLCTKQSSRHLPPVAISQSASRRRSPIGPHRAAAFRKWGRVATHQGHQLIRVCHVFLVLAPKFPHPGNSSRWSPYH